MILDRRGPVNIARRDATAVGPRGVIRSRADRVIE